MSTTLTIRNLDEDVKQRLRIRAAEKGHSMEAEAREILSAAVSEPSAPYDVQTEDRRKQLQSVIGMLKGRGSTEELMKITRGEDEE